MFVKINSIVESCDRMRKIRKIILIVLILMISILLSLLYKSKMNIENVNISERGEFAENIINLSKFIKDKCNNEKNSNTSITKLYTIKNGLQNPILKGYFPFLKNGKIEVNDNCDLRINIRNDRFKAVKGFVDFNITITELSDKIIENLEFYYLGDSLMEGQGNNYRGISYYMSKLYNTYTSKDYSKAMSLLTKPTGALTIQEQFDKFVDRLLASSEYSENTVIIFDGGVNDLYYKDIYKLRFNGTGNISNDYIVALKNSFNRLLDVQTKRQIEQPIIYMLPYGKDLLTFINSYASEFLSNKNILILNLNDILLEEDIYPDKVHIQESGYKKIVKTIYEMLDEYYKKG